jgi:hypothetical protein
MFVEFKNNNKTTMRNIYLALGLMVITKNLGVRHKKCLHGERERNGPTNWI